MSKTSTQTGEAGRALNALVLSALTGDTDCLKLFQTPVTDKSHWLDSESQLEIPIDKNIAPLCTKTNSLLYFCAHHIFNYRTGKSGSKCI